MYERMLTKQHLPNETEIKEYLGAAAWARMMKLEAILAGEYDFKKEMRFPFGNHYGWGMKYNHKTMHLCYAFFEKGAFTIMIQIGDRQVAELSKHMNELSKKAKQLWADRYPCGDTGGWVNIRILADCDLQDALCFIHAKKKPSSVPVS